MDDPGPTLFARYLTRRLLLPPKERLAVVAPASPRLPQVGHRLALLLQDLAYRRHLREHQSFSPRTPQGSLEPRSQAQRAGVVDSQSVKSTGVGAEERGYDGGKKVKGRKRHISLWTPRVWSSKRRSTAQRLWIRKRSSRCLGGRTSDSRASLICGWTGRLQRRGQGRGLLGAQDPGLERGCGGASEEARPRKRC
jgi:hypothetical protein